MNEETIQAGFALFFAILGTIGFLSLIPDILIGLRADKSRKADPCCD